MRRPGFYVYFMATVLGCAAVAVSYESGHSFWAAIVVSSLTGAAIGLAYYAGTCRKVLGR